MRMLLLSDTHGQVNETRELLQQYPTMDAYIHLGDIGFELKELYHFDIVSGNHDRFHTLPNEIIKAFDARHVLCIHGNLFDEETIQEVLAMQDIEEENIMEICMQTLYQKLASYACSKGCNTIFFGHTHHQVCVEVDGIVLVNPGSLCFGTPHSGYAIVEIEGANIQVAFHEVKGIGEEVNKESR